MWNESKNLLKTYNSGIRIGPTLFPGYIDCTLSLGKPDHCSFEIGKKT